jgi:flagellar basal-body rod protein FlgC
MVDPKIMSAAYGSTAILAGGLSATRKRLDVAAGNLANAETPGYRRRDVFLTALEMPQAEGSFSAALDRKTLMAPQVAAVVEDQKQGTMEYQPNHPLANAQGYVEMPNINMVETMTDMMSATRLYQANATALLESRSISQEARKILTTQA